MYTDEKGDYWKDLGEPEHNESGPTGDRWVGVIEATWIVAHYSGLSRKAARQRVRASLKTHPKAPRIYLASEAEKFGRWIEEQAAASKSLFL